MILDEYVISGVVTKPETKELKKMFKKNKKEAKSVTVEYYVNTCTVVEMLQDLKLLTQIAADVFGYEFPIMEPILVGEEIGDVSRRVNIKLHDNVTEFEWKE